MAFKTKVVLVVLLAALLIGVPPGLGQQPLADKRDNLYSIWLKLSMMGHNQSEIEGLLAGITGEQLQRLKKFRCGNTFMKGNNPQKLLFFHCPKFKSLAGVHTLVDV